MKYTCAIGHGGQFICIYPTLDVVVAVTSDSTRDWTGAATLIEFERKVFMENKRASGWKAGPSGEYEWVEGGSAQLTCRVPAAEHVQRGEREELPRRTTDARLLFERHPHGLRELRVANAREGRRVLLGDAAGELGERRRFEWDLEFEELVQHDAHL